MKHLTNRFGTIILITAVLIIGVSLLLHVFGDVSAAFQLIVGMLLVAISLLILVCIPVVWYRFNKYRRIKVMGRFGKR